MATNLTDPHRSLSNLSVAYLDATYFWQYAFWRLPWRFLEALGRLSSGFLETFLIGGFLEYFRGFF